MKKPKTSRCTMGTAMLVLALSGCVKDQCSDRVTLLPEGVTQAYENQEIISYRIEKTIAGLTTVDTLDFWAYQNDVEFTTQYNPTDCRDYVEIYSVEYFSEGSQYSLHYVLNASSEEDVVAYLKFSWFIDRIELEKRTIDIANPGNSQVYQVGENSTISYSIDSGLISASNDYLNLKRIQ